MRDVLLILSGYLLGSMPWGYWLPRLVSGANIRTVGSGNTGAANVWRTQGFKLGLSVALLDVAKGFAAALFGLWLGNELIGLLAGIAALIGHWRPLFMGFARGGKAVATCGGAFLAVAPVVGGIGLIVWIVTFALFRYASVASIVAALSLPVVAVLLEEPWPVIAFAALAALAVIVLHRPNISRLRAGTETRFRFRRRPQTPTGRPVVSDGRTGKARSS